MVPQYCFAFDLPCWFAYSELRSVSGLLLQAQDKDRSLLQAAMGQMNLLICAYHSILKLNHLVKDLAGSEDIQSPYQLKLMIC